MGRRTKKIFHQRRHTDGPKKKKKTDENMLNTVVDFHFSNN